MKIIIPNGKKSEINPIMTIQIHFPIRFMDAWHQSVWQIAEATNGG